MNRTRLFKRAKFLAHFTVVYNILEGIVAIALGIKEESVSLAGFGGDSLIEVASAALILWRLNGEDKQSQDEEMNKEKRTTYAIGVLFLLLAGLVAGSSTLTLLEHRSPSTTVPGVVISVLSLLIMLWLWQAKRSTAQQLNSMSLMSDAQCTLACIKLSVILFGGSLIYLIWPSLWWVDAVAAMILSFFIGKEGLALIHASKQANLSRSCC